MGWDGTRTKLAALAFCLAVGALPIVALAGCGGEAKPTSDEIDAPYLHVAKRAREFTFRIERATEDPPDRAQQLEREFRSFASNVDLKATFVLLYPHPVGPAGLRALTFVHSLKIYEWVLREVAKDARRGDQDFRGVRQVGAEVRRTGAAFESALKASYRQLTTRTVLP
jgi:hypothetical protein